jgi:hypothetical protein
MLAFAWVLRTASATLFEQREAVLRGAALARLDGAGDGGAVLLALPGVKRARLAEALNEDASRFVNEDAHEANPKMLRIQFQIASDTSDNDHQQTAILDFDPKKHVARPGEREPPSCLNAFSGDAIRVIPLPPHCKQDGPHSHGT